MGLGSRKESESPQLSIEGTRLFALPSPQDTSVKVLPLWGLHNPLPMHVLCSLLGTAFFACGHMGYLGCRGKFPTGAERRISSIFFLQKSPLVRSAALCTLSLPHTGILSGLKLWRPDACCHSLCEFTHAPVLLCLDGTISLESAATSGPYNLSASPSAQTLNLEGTGWIRTSHSALSSTPEHCCSTVPRQFHCFGTSMTISKPVSSSSFATHASFPRTRIIFWSYSFLTMNIVWTNKWSLYGAHQGNRVHSGTASPHLPDMHRGSKIPALLALTCILLVFLVKFA